ncbi:hypothetical protein DNJ95_12450 [Stutzerimonas kirkiae]|uniref:Uncharacterized protein n=1 Tax=Stutzerimonas kirkiae TaxID=2211392 RepID=A0A4Q9R1G5_9GAMM|nr:hypothetical protein DNJ96_14505 [Stutzerimonas kirkiae]TBV01281.1 hypothetical protein DNJ95_12450 [Stutzerimonas kirkiae]TBV10740.1 hypothetical protein DNK08_05345 [Stutzerimonas kirkiae]TBV14532.1 hypothetical protein DNK01_08195 [Stutzerimonas kirkiae]
MVFTPLDKADEPTRIMRPVKRCRRCGQGDRAMHGKQSKAGLEGSGLDERAWRPVFLVQLSSLQRFYRSTLPGE